MKQKKIETLLYSAVGLAVMFLIVVAVNLIANAFKTRVDLTEQKLYTLSPGTKAILKKLDSPVEIRFYYSQGISRKPSDLENYARSVEDLLGELSQASRGKIEIKKFDPRPDSEEEDLANLDGVEGQLLQTGEKFYLGLCVSLDPRKEALPFLSPLQEKLLEYDLARTISQVLSTNKPVIGVMTALPVFGQPMNPMMARMGQQGQDPWAFMTELKRDFEVKQLNFDVEKIDDEIKVLLVIHPKDLKDSAQYALDQFVMRGGKLIACLDAMCLADANRQNPMMPMPGGPSNLDKLLKTWGVTFETTKVIADMNLARKLRTRQNAPPELMPNLLFLTDKSINKQEVIASQLDELLFAFPGHFTGTPVAGLKQTILLTSSTNAQPVEGFMAQMSPAKIIEDFKGEGKKFTLAMRLEGKFKTAFPEGKPEAKADDADKKEDKKSEDKAKDTLKECKEDNAVVLIGDTDWLADQFSVQIQNFFGQKIIQSFNGNLSLVQNLVEQMAGDQNLIAVRSRATQSRPFTVVKEKQAQAQARYQEKIASLQKQVDETNQKLGELQGKKEAGQRFVLSKEQQEEIERFKVKKAKANQDLKRVRRDLDQDINALENRLKWLNIAGMPVVVAIAGIALGVSRKQKTKAQ